MCMSTLSRVQLCDPMDCIPPGSSVHGIYQARILEWIASSLSRDLPDAGIQPVSLELLALSGRFFTTEPPGKPFSVHVGYLKLENGVKTVNTKSQ